MVYQKTARRPAEDYQKNARRPAEDQQKTIRRPAEDCQKITRRPLEGHQKTARRPPEYCQKTTRRPLAVFWQSSNTMIQGNFYKRLDFYMDSCALSPMASLFVEYTKKKTSVFQIQLEFWVNMTLCFWLMYSPPPWKSWILSELQLFQSFPTKVAQNDSEQPILLDLQLFQSFPTKVAQNDSEWPISPDSQLFQSFPTKVAQNDSKWPI